MHRDIATRPSHPPSGMTLLEVLIACGILVVGLASVAAMLPAAGSRLAEATAIDRGGTLSANCLADLRSRGVLKASTFPADTIKAVMLGDMFSTVGAFGTTPFARVTSTTLKVPATVFRLGDEWLLDTDNLPQPKDGAVCCVAMLAPVDATKPVAAGSMARLSIAVFRKESAEAQLISLTRTGSGVFRLASTGGSADVTRRRFLAGCGAVLVVPSSGAPRWLHVGSSWTPGRSQAGQWVADVSYVSFTDPALADQLAGSGNLSVWGFTQLIRVDERTVTLE